MHLGIRVDTVDELLPLFGSASGRQVKNGEVHEVGKIRFRG
jgi:hypothetical protein